MKLFMGIDTGTQGVRIGIVNEDGKLLAENERKWETDFPKLGWAEQSPITWWENIISAMKSCIASLTDDERKAICCCSVCATSSTAIAIDEEGNPLMPALMWMDARSKKEMKEINRTKHEILEYCGNEVSFEWLIPKVLWIKKNRPEIYEKSYRIVEQLDWINFKLCGEWTGSICNASCKWNYVQSKGGFSKDYFNAIGLEDYENKIITDIRKIGDFIGTLREDLAEELGLNPNMQIVEGAIDAHMALFGMNAFAEKKMGVIMGTSFVHLSQVKERPFIKGIWGPYDSAIMDGYWLMEGGQISAAGLVNWFRKNFHIPEKDGNPYKVLIEAAEEIPVGSEGLTVLDFFQGNRTPYKNADAKGVIYGLNIKHTWKHIYRAVLESIAYGTKNIIDNQSSQGYDVERIVACGGVTHDENWMQIISDVTGRELVINENNQAGVMGCCVVAAAALDEKKDVQKVADRMIKVKKRYIPNPKNVEAYKEPYKKYLELYQNLVGMMSE